MTVGERVRRVSGRVSLFWRIVMINALVLVIGALVLVFSPATVSARVSWTEAAGLAVGLIVVLVANALLLRASLTPLDRLMRLMEDVDILRPGQRLPESGTADVARLIRTFNAMLSRLEAERGASSAHVLVAQEAERHRIAQELHDEIGQSLTVVLLGLKRVADRAPQPDLRDEIVAIQDVARESLDEVRHVARRLRPGELEDLGLLSALAALATDISTHTGVPIQRGISPGLPKLRADRELVLYRVAQEGLTNAARHAHASLIELSLSRQGESVALRIADDGRGLGNRAEGAGIRGMRERAMLIDADIRIGPRTNGGTEVRLVVPVNVESHS